MRSGGQMAEGQEWQKRRAEEFVALGESIVWSDTVFSTIEEGIEGSRHYGVALLAHSIECARAIRLCISKELPGPAFALARGQYEGALRGHIVVNEIDLEVLNELLNRTPQWWQDKHSQRNPPRIEIRRNKWWILPETRRGFTSPRQAHSTMRGRTDLARVGRLGNGKA